ncbi:MAG: addiction module protein [Thermaerobacter sp.]|nr:addiction module protein [Thermaerobacter sp.]
MSTRVPWPPFGFDELSPEEKVDCVQSLWDCMAAADDRVPVPEWHKEVIRQRLADPDASPREWDQVRDRIARDLHRPKPNA